MVNRCEPLLNIVTLNKPKVLKVLKRNHRLGPKGKGAGIGAYDLPIADEAPPVKRRNLSQPKQVQSRNLVSP